MANYENTNLINRESDALIEKARTFSHTSDLLNILKDPKTQIKSNEERVRLIQAVARELEKKEHPLVEKSESSKTLETPSETFCGIATANLIPTQQELFAKLTPVQREELSQKISINKTQGQIEFTQIKKAIKDSDIATNVTKKSADDAIKKLGNGWGLPKDVDYSDENRLKLNPEASEYDAMILQMPGANDDEKAENFRLLTGMRGWYWTAQNYNKSSSKFVIREFNENDRDRSRYNGLNSSHVRPVRSL